MSSDYAPDSGLGSDDAAVKVIQNHHKKTKNKKEGCPHGNYVLGLRIFIVWKMQKFPGQGWAH